MREKIPVKIIIPTFIALVIISYIALSGGEKDKTELTLEQTNNEKMQLSKNSKEHNKKKNISKLKSDKEIEKFLKQELKKMPKKERRALLKKVKQNNKQQILKMKNKTSKLKTVVTKFVEDNQKREKWLKEVDQQIDERVLNKPNELILNRKLANTKNEKTKNNESTEKVNKQVDPTLEEAKRELEVNPESFNILDHIKPNQ